MSRFRLVRCRSCKTLQTFDLWKGNREKEMFNKKNCCCNCGKKSYTVEVEDEN